MAVVNYLPNEILVDIFEIIPHHAMIIHPFAEDGVVL